MRGNKALGETRHQEGVSPPFQQSPKAARLVAQRHRPALERPSVERQAPSQASGKGLRFVVPWAGDGVKMGVRATHPLTSRTMPDPG